MAAALPLDLQDKLNEPRGDPQPQLAEPLQLLLGIPADAGLVAAASSLHRDVKLMNAMSWRRCRR